MASHTLEKIMSWVKEDLNDSSLNVRRNSLMHSKAHSSHPYKRHDTASSYLERPITNGAMIVKTSDFLPSSPQAELAVLRKQSQLSLRSEDDTDIPSISFEDTSEKASISSGTVGEPVQCDKTHLPHGSLNSAFDTRHETLDINITQSNLTSENQELKRNLEIKKLQIKEARNRYEQSQILAYSREREISKLNSLVSTLRRLVSLTSTCEPNDDHMENTKAGERDTDLDPHGARLQGLIGELVSEQKKCIELTEKHQLLNKDFGKLSLQQIENDEIIQELKRDLATSQIDIARYESEKERMQTRLNNYVWKAQFSS
jgi:DNA repair exonuclease SbcCD ATPase subunit